MPVELIQEEVLPVQHDRVQGPPAVGDWAPYTAWGGGSVVMVHAHAVDSQFRQVRGDLFSILVGGEISAEAQVDAPDS